MIKYRKICHNCGNKFKAGKLAKYCSLTCKQKKFYSENKINNRSLIKESLQACLGDSGKAGVNEFINICLWVWSNKNK